MTIISKSDARLSLPVHFRVFYGRRTSALSSKRDRVYINTLCLGVVAGRDRDGGHITAFIAQAYGLSSPASQRAVFGGDRAFEIAS